MNKEINEIILLGKDSIVQLALNLIDEKIGVQDFSKIKVMANNRTVFVSFMNPIKYLPINSAFYFDLGVDLLEKTITHSPLSNGTVDQEKKTQFYKETTMNIKFVIETINKSDEIGSIDITNFEDDMTIREYENYYDVSIVSRSQESSYKMEKTSGKIYDIEHALLEPPPFKNEGEDILMEIN